MRGNKGNYGIAFRLLKDKLLHEDPLNLDYLQTIKKEDVLVQGGTYDAIGSVFDCATIPFIDVDSAGGIEKVKLSPASVLFANCGAHFTDLKPIQNFVEEGGMLVTTDHMVGQLSQAFPSSIKQGGLSAQNMCKVVIGEDPVVSGFKNNWSDTDPEWMVVGGSMPVDIVDKEKVRVLVKEKNKGAPILVQFNHGKGCVYHMVSHYAIQRKCIPDAGITTQELFKIGCASDSTFDALKKANPNVYDVQSCLGVLEFTLRVILKQRLKWHENNREVLPKQIWDILTEQSQQATKPTENTAEPTPKQRIMSLVSACMLNEGKNFESADENRRTIHDCLHEIAQVCQE